MRHGHPHGTPLYLDHPGRYGLVLGSPDLVNQTTRLTKEAALSQTDGAAAGGKSPKPTVFHISDANSTASANRCEGINITIWVRVAGPEIFAGLAEQIWAWILNVDRTEKLPYISR